MSDAVEMVIEPRTRPVGSGEVRRLLPFRRRRMIGPFIFCDLMGPDDLAPGTGMNVDAHPHIGLSTVTYLFEGRAVHRDSLGSVQTIEPGAVNWMTAAAGITHTERSHPDDLPTSRVLHGVQTWVALPTDAEDGRAGFEHCPVHEVPEDVHGEVGVRLAVGSGFGMTAPIVGSSALVLAELFLDDAGIVVDTSHPERAVVAIDHDLSLGGSTLPAGHLAVLEEGTRPEVHGHGRALLLGGAPVGDRHIWWNFVSSDPERIEAAKDDWTAQRFPTVPDDHDPWVPLPA